MSWCCLQAVVGCTGLWGHELMMPAGIFHEMETQCDNLQDPACPVHHLSFPLSPQRLLGGEEQPWTLLLQTPASAAAPGMVLDFCEVVGSGDAGKSLWHKSTHRKG